MNIQSVIKVLGFLLLVTAEMARGMRSGSVIVDLAAETGGNVEGAEAGFRIRAAARRPGSVVAEPAGRHAVAQPRGLPRQYVGLDPDPAQVRQALAGADASRKTSRNASAKRASPSAWPTAPRSSPGPACRSTASRSRAARAVTRAAASFSSAMRGRATATGAPPEAASV